MSDPKSKNDDKTKILPLGQPAVSAEFSEFRNMVLTSISTEEAERVLVEMSHDMSSFTFDEDEQPVDFSGSLLPVASPDALPSSQILAEGSVESPDEDFTGFDPLEFNEGDILAQIEERVVDLEGGALQLGEDDVEAATITHDLGADSVEKADDLSGFNDLNMGSLDLDAADTGLEDLDFQTEVADPDAEVEAPSEAPTFDETPAFEKESSITEAEAEAEAVDPSLLALDFGDDPVADEQPGVPAELVETFRVETQDTDIDAVEFELPEMDFEPPSEPAALEEVSEDAIVDAFDPSAFDLPESVEEIATEAFSPDFGASEVDLLIDGAAFDELVSHSGQDQEDATDLGIPDFEAQDQQNDTFENSDTYAAIEGDFTFPSDDEPVDMVAVISSEREVVDDTPPVYDALEGERILLVEETTTLETEAEEDPEEAASPVAVDEIEPARPIIAENTKIRDNRRWRMPIAASIAALALAAGGAGYYYSIGTPGLEQYLGGPRPIAASSTETMPGTDVSQVVLPQNFEPVNEPAPYDPGQGNIIPDMAMNELAPPQPSTPIKASPEIVALFAELDAASGPMPVTPAVAGDAGVALDDMPVMEEFDFGLDKAAAAVDLEPRVVPEAMSAESEVDQTSAPVSAPTSDAGLASIVAVQDMFAQQLITLKADIEDLKTASFTAPGQANVMGEIMLEVTRLAEQITVVNARLMGVEGRVASAQTVTLPGANNADAETLRRLEQQMEMLSNNVGIIARMAAGSSNSAVPGFNAVSDAPSAPSPAPRPPAEAPRVSDTPNQAAGFTISSKPTNASALGQVAKGDFVEGYGYVLDVMRISGGGKLVQMENGTVLVE